MFEVTQNVGFPKIIWGMFAQAPGGAFHTGLSKKAAVYDGVHYG